MPRTQRLIIKDKSTVYHVMSRTALDGFPLGDIEKDFMLDLNRRYVTLYLVEILGFCLRRTSVSKAKKSASEGIGDMSTKQDL